MSTFIDGAPPSVAPDPDDSRPEPDQGEQTGHAGEDRPDEGSAWLREELARRVATANSSSGGRHARRDNAAPALSAGGPARHSASPARPVGGPALPVRPPRRDRVPGDPQGAAHPARDDQRLDPGGPGLRPDPWTGPRPARRSPGAVPGGPSLPTPADPLARTPPPTRPAQPGVPLRPATAARSGAGLPSRPAPPSGAAAARLLSPPAEPPQAAVSVPVAPAPLAQPPVAGAPVSSPPARPPTPPNGLSPSGAEPAGGAPSRGAPSRDALTHHTLPPMVRRPDPGPPTGPVRDEPGEPEPEDEILWSADDLPPARPIAPPEQRAAEPEAEPPHGACSPGSDDTDAELTVKRVRVVLAERKGVARPVRTVVDIQEGTAVGELLRTNLIGSQLWVAVRFAAFAAVTLGSLPLLFAWFPAIGEVDVLGLRLPWLLLGVLVYPFLLGLGWWHTRMAERVEQNFADHVQE